MNNNKTFNTLTTLLLSIILFVISFIALTSFNNNTANAYLEWPVGDCPVYRGPFRGEVPSGWNVPADIYFGLNRADCNINSPSVSFYTTIASSPTSSSITVPSGTVSVDLAFRGAATVGWRPSSAVYTRYTVVGASSGVSGIVGEFVQTDLSGGPNTVGYTDISTPNTFTFAPPGGFTASRNYSGTLTVKVGQTFNNRGPACVANGAPASGIYDPNCPNSIVVFNVNVTVTPPPTRGCTNPAATNYNPSATIDDGSCTYPPDLCLNIPGRQTTVPVGLTRNAAGNCVPIPTGVNCPSYPPYPSFSNPNVQVTLPNIAKPEDSSGPRYNESTIDFGTWSESGNVRTRNQTQRAYVLRTYYVYITTQPQPRTEVNRVDSSHSGLPNIAVDFDDNSDDDGTAELDYTSLVDDYPYDEHNPVVWYQTRYERRTVVHEIFRYRTLVQTRPNATAPWGPSSGAFPAWPSTGTPDSSTDRSTGFFWTALGSTPALTTLPPCYPRNFSARPTASGAALNPNPENPSNSNFSFSIPVDLTLPEGGALRTPTSITVSNIPYTVTWNARGYSNPSYSGSVSGTATVPNSSLATSVTRDATLSTAVPVSVGVSIPANIKAGDQICWTITVAEPIGTVKVGGEIWQRQGPPRSSSACTIYALDQPYSRFFGADVFAGGGFRAADDTCEATNPNALAFGPMRGNNSGTGAQLAVFALNQISGVQPLSRTTRSPLQLAFSNQPQSSLTPPTIVGGTQFGGGFGQVMCVHDYLGDIPDSPTYSIGNDVNIAGLASGRYYYNSDVSVYGQLPYDATAGRRVVIYAEGDVSIRANSDASGTGRVGFADNNREWSNLNQIPSLYIIASGNIYIDDGVTELDGGYISQGGEIYTCAIGFSPPSDAQRTVQCRTQLQVNGAFLANKVNLFRTLGSLRESYPLEVPVRDPTPADPAATTPPSSRAAEIFIYDPTLWFTNGGGLPSSSKIQIDSYTTLPPSL